MVQAVIRRQTIDHSERYHGAIAAINARLQVGTTPGNPNLVSQWNVAQAELAKIDGDVADIIAYLRTVPVKD